MRRKRKRNERKKVLFILAPVIIVASLALIGAFLIFTPMLTNKLLGEDEIKSPYIQSTTQKQVEERLNRKKIEYQTIELVDEGETYQITLTGEEVVKLSSSKDVDTQIDTLHGILRRLTIDSKNARQIDLRFSKPIVTLY